IRVVRHTGGNQRPRSGGVGGDGFHLRTTGAPDDENTKYECADECGEEAAKYGRARAAGSTSHTSLRVTGRMLPGCRPRRSTADNFDGAPSEYWYAVSVSGG